MKKLILITLLFVGYIIPQEYAVKDTTETAMDAIRRMATELEELIYINFDTKVNLNSPNPIGIVNYPSYKDFYEAMMDSIALIWHELKRDTIPPPPDYPATPTNFLVTGVVANSGRFNLSWNSSDSVIIWSGSSSANLQKEDTVNAITSGWQSQLYTAPTTRWYSLTALKNNLQSAPTVPALSASITAPLPTGPSFYVSLNGTGNGSSWGNSRSFSSLDGNWDIIPANTTIYIDGGTDSVVYDVNQYNLNTQGTANSRIIITKGIDAGHNGKVVFRNTSPNYIGMGLSDIHYTTFYDLEWKGRLVAASGETWLIDFGGDVTNVTFSYCDFILNYSCGIGTNTEATSDNIKFLHCNCYNNTDYSDISTDQFWLGGSGHKNWEFGWTNFIMSNSHLGNPDSHRDVIQVEFGWNNGGTMSIHDCFFDDRSGGYAGAHVESGTPPNTLRGDWYIYNNIFKSNSAGDDQGGAYSLLSLTAQGNTYATRAYVYNNIFILASNKARPPIFFGWDVLEFKNNIVYSSVAANNDYGCVVMDGWTEQHSPVFDYNQYYNQGNGTVIVGENNVGSGARNYTFAQWQGVPQDLHSTFNTDTPDFLDIDGTDGIDYALDTGSDGINEGTTIALSSPDPIGTYRPQGTAYDIGAYEFIESGGGGSNKDSIPDAFQSQLISVTNAEPGQIYPSPDITFTAFDTTTTIRISAGAEYRIGAGGLWRTTPSTVTPTTNVATVRDTAGPYSTTKICTLTVGGVNGTFSITSMADPGSGSLYDLYEDFTDGDFTSDPAWTPISDGGLRVVPGVSIPWAGTNNSALTADGDSYLYTSNTTTEGTWEWDMYTGPSIANVYINVFYMDDNTELEASGMEIEVKNNKRITVYQLAGDPEGTHIQTALNYLLANTWYGFKVTRTAAGLTHVYIKSQAIPTYTLINPSVYGANPFTDTFGSTCNYFIIGIGEGRMITNIKVY